MHKLRHLLGAFTADLVLNVNLQGQMKFKGMVDCVCTVNES